VIACGAFQKARGAQRNCRWNSTLVGLPEERCHGEQNSTDRGRVLKQHRGRLTDHWSTPFDTLVLVGIPGGSCRPVFCVLPFMWHCQ
jgi:hypothetical protein